MHNLIKLVQANGKALVVPAAAIAIVRTLEPQEREASPHGKSGVWLNLGGVAQHTVVRENFGFILRKAGGNSGERIQIAGMAGTKISLPRSAFAHAIESERIDKDGQGKEIGREDATIVHTALHSNAGPVAFFAKESAGDLHDMLSADVSDDDGADEDEGEEPDEG